MSRENLKYVLGHYANCSESNFGLHGLDLDKISITGLCADSRKIRTGNVFFAIVGDHHDSHLQIPEMVKAGASAIVHELELAPETIALCLHHRTCCVRVKHTREALSYAASQWFGRPQDELVMVGVTGTDGKSSTVFFTWQLLIKAGIKAGFFSTVAISYGGNVLDNDLRQSTPEPLELFSILARMRDEQLSHVVMESTSHGLSEKTARLQEIAFQAAAFTNLSHEHLEFHGTYENYRNDKGNLFRKLQANLACNFPSPKAVINRGDSQAEWFYQTSSDHLQAQNILLYESELNLTKQPTLPDAYLRAINIVQSPDAVQFDLCIGQSTIKNCSIGFPGAFNVENVCAALVLASQCLNCSVSNLVKFLPSLVGVKGRLVPVKLGQPYTVLIDYAHTPGSFAKILPQIAAVCKNRLIIVFGSAGERDKEKRPMLGSLAAQYGQVLVLTNEDPRLEDELAIIDQIKAGARLFSKDIPIECIPNRRLAIEKALGIAQVGDTVAFLGKGHERSIVVGDRKMPWDEETQVREVLLSMGFKN